MARMEPNARRAGFTLVELMIVVAIIGVLAAIAIPSFINYQLTSKRAEAFMNLSSLGKAQKSYFAEFNSFVAVAAEPSFALGVDPTTVKRDEASVNTAFAEVGWAPEGAVYFDYDTATALEPLGGGCGACNEVCFTSTAYGDLDGNGSMSLVVYAHPDASGEYCSTGLLNRDPPVYGGVRQFDQAVRDLDADVY